MMILYRTIKDSIYTQRWREEVAKFYDAAFASTKEQSILITKEAITLYKKRQADYFSGDKLIFQKLDDIFLSMEGLGQYMSLAWLINPKGGNIDFATAVKGVRRGKSQWSQEEGLALFLVLTKLTKPDWANDMFGKYPKNVIALLEDAVH